MLLVELAKLEETTGLEEIRKQIKYKEDDVCNELISEFYRVRMLTVLEAVNEEVTSVIGPSWSVFC